MSTTTEPKQVKVWNVNGIINREKRAGKVPSEVSEKNVLPKTARRSRADYDYNENKTYREYESNDLGVLKVPEASKHTKSNNVYEKRAGSRLVLANKENSKPANKPAAATKKPVEEKPQPIEDAAAKSTTPVRKRKSSLKGVPVALSDKVLSQIERLGGKLQTSIAPRKYSDQKDFLPAQIQTFLDIAWASNKFVLNDGDVELLEFKLEDAEWNDIEFLSAHKDTAVLFADGDDLACFVIDEVSEDPTVYILPSEGSQKKTCLSKYLARLSVAK